MNAKKVSILLLSGAGIAMLAACAGSKGITRADSEKLLDDMATAITNKSGYTAPTKVTVTTESSVAEYSTDDLFAHKKYSGTSSYTDANSSKVSVSVNTEAWIYVKDNVAVYAVDDGSTKKYVEGLVDLTKTIPSGKVTTQVKSMEGSPAYISSYLKKFDNLTSTSNFSGVTVGATAGGKATALGIKDENYTSSKAGYLDAKFTAVYANETPADEPLEYKYENNMLVYTYNGKKNTHTAYNWGTAATSYFTQKDFTKIDSYLSVEGIALIAEATALI
jgi:hypothetical protein